MKLTLRSVRPSDLPIFFEHQADQQAADLAGFISRGRTEFDEHWHMILADPTALVRTVDLEGRVAGYVTAFLRDGTPEIAYWFGREYWGRGIGRASVARFLASHAARPIFGSVVATNVASISILRRCGFTVVSEDIAPDGRAEYLLRLD